MLSVKKGSKNDRPLHLAGKVEERRREMSRDNRCSNGGGAGGGGENS